MTRHFHLLRLLRLAFTVVASAVFVTAGAAKLMDPTGTDRLLRMLSPTGYWRVEYRSVVGATLPMLEVALGCMILIPSLRRLALAGGAILVFILSVVVAPQIAAVQSCGCKWFFADWWPQSAASFLARNGALVALLAALWALHPRVRASQIPGEASPTN